MSTVLRIGTQGKSQTGSSGHPSPGAGPEDLDTRVALIQALIPLGLQAVEDVLHQEVQTLAGPRYARGDAMPHRVRWGRQRGSVYYYSVTKRGDPHDCWLRRVHAKREKFGENPPPMRVP
jgi:hypothetical protein